MTAMITLSLVKVYRNVPGNYFEHIGIVKSEAVEMLSQQEALDRAVEELKNAANLSKQVGPPLGGINRTLFNELRDENGNLPAHIENVKSVGCKIAEKYYELAAKPEYSDPPADVRAYKKAHCQP